MFENSNFLVSKVLVPSKLGIFDSMISLTNEVD